MFLNCFKEELTWLKIHRLLQYRPGVLPAGQRSDNKQGTRPLEKFYPHESFVGLIRDTISVVTRKQKVSIWVEGAYGTGKSHAVLTLKKLLDASPEATIEYFDKYKDQLSGDLYNQFSQIKSGDKILTVHRYGSSNIKNDNSLVFAIQNSIIEALKDGGFSGMGQNSLRDSTVEWLSDEANKVYFNTLISKQYEDLFGGDNTDDIISKLNSYSGASLQEIMDKVMKVAEERQFKALSLDPDRLTEWINSVIRENNLKALILYGTSLLNTSGTICVR